jgi:hypothetical protein
LGGTERSATGPAASRRRTPGAIRTSRPSGPDQRRAWPGRPAAHVTVGSCSAIWPPNARR